MATILLESFSTQLFPSLLQRNKAWTWQGICLSSALGNQNFYSEPVSVSVQKLSLDNVEDKKHLAAIE